MIRTRFAPSPTGYLHIGGVRTALYNWLFARSRGGRYVLRIDDTDRQRNIDEALAPILDGFRWLGLDWDEGPDVGGEFGPYYQSQRAELYAQAVETLLGRGLAYRDYATTEELQAEREEAQASKRRFIYSRRWMAESKEDAARFESEGRTGVVRLKMPRDGVCRFDDAIRGSVSFEWALEQDHVIQRADGSCLYHLASAVDDHTMKISDVIRAEEHLSNTPRQIFIAQGLGYSLPRYAHLPVVAEPGSRNKLSKRKLDKYLKNPDFSKIYEHGKSIADAIGIPTSAGTFNPLIVDFYRQVGYRAEALTNYLLLLGWALDDRTEFFSRQEMIDRFTLDRVGKAPASFDSQKLLAFQEHYMGLLPASRKGSLALPYLQRSGLVSDPASQELADRVNRVAAAAGDRIKVDGDILDYADFFISDDALPYDAKALAKRVVKPEGAVERLERFRDRLAAVEPFDAATLESTMKEFIDAEGIKIGQIIHAVRVAVTGKAVGFGMFETLEILGRESCQARIDRACALAREAASAG